MFACWTYLGSPLWHACEQVYCVRSVVAAVWQSEQANPAWVPESANEVVTLAWAENVPPDQLACVAFAAEWQAIQAVVVVPKFGVVCFTTALFA